LSSSEEARENFNMKKTSASKQTIETKDKTRSLGSQYGFTCVSIKVKMAKRINKMLNLLFSIDLIDVFN
jgi:hypothetical protein